MAKVASFVNRKGGVGKTTSTMNVSRALHQKGFKVLMIDLDPQANLTQHTTVEVDDAKGSVYASLMEGKPFPVYSIEEGWDIVPSEHALQSAERALDGIDRVHRLKKGVDLVLAQYDYILIDCSPSLGLLTQNAIAASDEIFVVLQSEIFAISGITDIMEMIQQAKNSGINPNVKLGGMFVTQVNNTLASKSIEEMLRNAHGDKVLQTRIRRNVAIHEAQISKQSVLDYDANSNGAADYKQLTEEIYG